MFHEVSLRSRRQVTISLRVLGGADGFVVMTLDIYVPGCAVTNLVNIPCFVYN
jgi:hypothetical protein